MRQLWLLVALLSLCLPTAAWAQATALKCAMPPQVAPQTGWPMKTYRVFLVSSAGALVTNFTGVVTVTLGSAPGGGAIGGTTSVTAATVNMGAGVGTVSAATFSDIILTGQGTYTLTFSATGVTSCTTNSFTVIGSFHPTSTSPARGAGLAQPGVITTDYDGISVSQSGAIDAGALQFRVPTPGGGGGGGDPPGGGGGSGDIPPPQNLRFGPT